MLTPRRVPKRWPLCGHLLIKEKRKLEEKEEIRFYYFFNCRIGKFGLDLMTLCILF